MATALQQQEFLRIYEDYAQYILKPTELELREFFHEWKDPSAWVEQVRSSRMPAPSPIKRTTTRIKRPESVADKIYRKPSSFPDGFSDVSIRSMRDTLGARVVVYFLSNLPMVDRALRTSEVLEISASDPPIAYLSRDLIERLGLTHIRHETKESGYASIHYIVRLRSSSLPLENRPWFEVQVRTLAEDVWGEIEHLLGYKPNKRTSFAVRKQFQIIGSQLTAIDEHFNLLYEELARFQEEATYRDLDPLNAENLPPVLSEFGVSCAQREIDGLLKLLTSRGLRTVGELRERAKSRTIQIIREVFVEEEERPPSNFEIVAGIAATNESQSESDIRQSVLTQLQFLKAWEELKPVRAKEVNGDS